MKYIIESESFFIKKQEIEKIINFANFKKENIYIFDFEENEFDKFFDQYLSNSIFGEKKLVILNNCIFLQKKIINKNFIIKLEKFFNTNIDNYLILSTNKFNDKNDFIIKFIKERKLELISIKKPDKKELFNFLNKKLKDNNYYLSYNDLRKLLRYTKYDYDILNNELKKLFLIKEQKYLKNLNLIIYDYVGENIFKLYDALLEKDQQNIYKILLFLKGNNISPVLILEYLIKELQYILIIKNYYNLKIEDKTPLLELKLNNYRLKKMTENANNYSYFYINKILNKLIGIVISFKSNSNRINYQLFIAKMILISCHQ
ncbi:DNA polymerase III subunit delta [Candidatus Hepatoplasma crinochetorum Av]|uniref:DNA polymerase III subunit delta n=1 Tax=Candidatus Hepatoplasma crinochetorum Av TaxID=1427984 RepID=W8GSM5_9MOLU|nr:DNA polymerase III subunit delta [Candidatus Hepatoplasma crinochetorum]AHK22400.1 DNA polymerase III subunit delta [Candidatus Hepatoplasma crinochetorum Av]